MTTSRNCHLHKTLYSASSIFVLCLEGIHQAIGFLYKNDPSSQSFKDCVCSVDIVEELTGFDFFTLLPDDIEDVVESDSNLSKRN